MDFAEVHFQDASETGSVNMVMIGSEVRFFHRLTVGCPRDIIQRINIIRYKCFQC